MRSLNLRGHHQRFAAFLLASLVLSACAAPSSTSATREVEPDGTPTATAAPTLASTESGSTTIVVWLPPSFDPSGGSQPASLLQDRLDEFSEQHPQVQIVTRVKAETGTGGMLDSLLTAQQAAPLALPDLVLMPHTQLTAAAQAGVLTPLDELAQELQSDDWYAFAKQMADVDGQPYAIPFSGDALVLAYRPTAVNRVPASWNEVIQGDLALGFAAADPNAFFTLVQLNDLRDEETGNASYSAEVLASVFQFLTSNTSAFPFWLSQYQTYDQSWQAFSEGRVPMVAAWTSRVFDARNQNVVGAPLPTQSGEPFTLVRGWAWAVSATLPERAAIATELAQFLTTPEFIAQWTSAAGMLPPRHSSLAAWTPDEQQALASQIADSAAALPDEAEIDLWGSALAEAVVSLLKQETTPEDAAQAVMMAVANP